MSPRIDLLDRPIPVQFLPKTLSDSKKSPGEKIALALAYVDGHTVIDHLNEVIGAANWKVTYEAQPVEKGFAYLCHLEIETEPGRWVDKCAVGEGEDSKSAQTDSLKRAARVWGVGRFLQSIPNRWRKCRTYQDRQGKDRFSEWLEDPMEGLEWIPKAEDHPITPTPSPTGRVEEATKETRTPERGEEPQPTDMQVSIEKWCGFWSRKGVGTELLRTITQKRPSEWGSDVLLRFDQVVKRLKAEAIPPRQALEEEFGKLF